jgi:hypothetical protein
MEVGALEVGHSLKALLPYEALLIPNQEKHNSSAAVAARRSSNKEVRAMCAIISMPVSGSLPTTDPDYGCAESSGIVMLTLYLSKS